MNKTIDTHRLINQYIQRERSTYMLAYILCRSLT